MEEKILIKSQQYNVKKLFLILIIVGALLSVGLFAFFAFDYLEYYNCIHEAYLEHQEQGYCIKYYSAYFGEYFTSSSVCSDCELVKVYDSSSGAIGYVFDHIMDEMIIILIPIVSLSLVGLLLFLWLRSYELTVTDKRIFGKVAWGKRVDLPVDSVSATATIRLLKGVSVSTSSGRISFRILKNANEIYEVISKLLIERQQEKTKNVAVAAPVRDETDQLKKYKELLDGGVISQEEFDAKKKQLLGL